MKNRGIGLNNPYTMENKKSVFSYYEFQFNVSSNQMHEISGFFSTLMDDYSMGWPSLVSHQDNPAKHHYLVIQFHLRNGFLHLPEFLQANAKVIELIKDSIIEIDYTSNPHQEKQGFTLLMKDVDHEQSWHRIK